MGPLIRTDAWEPGRADRETAGLRLALGGDLAGQCEFVPTAIKEEQVRLSLTAEGV